MKKIGINISKNAEKIVKVILISSYQKKKNNVLIIFVSNVNKAKNPTSRPSRAAWLSMRRISLGNNAFKKKNKIKKEKIKIGS